MHADANVLYSEIALFSGVGVGVGVLPSRRRARDGRERRLKKNNEIFTANRRFSTPRSHLLRRRLC